jgi:hypothetical protein
MREPTDLTDPIWRTALELARPQVRGKRIRLVGVTASNFDTGEQLGLFSADDPKQRHVVEASDAIRRRWGERAVTRARLIGTRLPAPFERDHGTAAERRGAHAADAQARERGRPIRPITDARDAAPSDRDSQPDIDVDEPAPDDA